MEFLFSFPVHSLENKAYRMTIIMISLSSQTLCLICTIPVQVVFSLKENTDISPQMKKFRGYIQKNLF